MKNIYLALQNLFSLLQGSRYTLRKRKSPVWTYMEQTSFTTVVCLICKSCFSYSGSTTGMMRHLRNIHPVEYSALLGKETPKPPPQPGQQKPKSPQSGPLQPEASQQGAPQHGPCTVTPPAPVKAQTTTNP